MRQEIIECFKVLFLFVYQSNCGIFKASENETTHLTETLNEAERSVKEYKIPQAKIQLLKPQGFSISIPGKIFLKIKKGNF